MTNEQVIRITIYERARLRLQAFAMLGRQDGWNYDPLQRKEKADELVEWALSDSIVAGVSP